VLQARGLVEIKGKGAMRTWYLIGRKPVADESSDRVADESRTAHV
jgi:adenylate cyclase